MKESSIGSRTREAALEIKNYAEKEASPRWPPFLWPATRFSENSPQWMKRPDNSIWCIKTLWMTRCGSGRIFLADGPGLLRLQDRGYRVLRLVSR